MARLSPRIQQQKSLPSIGSTNKTVKSVFVLAHTSIHKVWNVQKRIGLCGEIRKDFFLFHAWEIDSRRNRRRDRLHTGQLCVQAILLKSKVKGAQERRAPCRLVHWLFWRGIRAHKIKFGCKFSCFFSFSKILGIKCQ